MYFCSEDVYQTAKVAKILLLLNAGRGSEFMGKSLAEIQVSGDVVDYDENITEKHSSDPKASSSKKFETIDNSTATSLNAFFQSKLVK